MHNVQMQIADDTLLICVGLRPAEEPVKTHIIASTRGNTAVDGRPDLRVALVVWTATDSRDNKAHLNAGFRQYSKGPGE